MSWWEAWWVNGGLPDFVAVVAWCVVCVGGILTWERVTRDSRARRAQETRAMLAWEATMKALPTAHAELRASAVRLIPATHPAAQECPTCGAVFAGMTWYAPQAWRSPCGHVFWLEPLERPFVTAEAMREALR